MDKYIRLIRLSFGEEIILKDCPKPPKKNNII